MKALKREKNLMMLSKNAEEKLLKLGKLVIKEIGQITMDVVDETNVKDANYYVFVSQYLVSTFAANLIENMHMLNQEFIRQTQGIK